jgi:hypothetical protein
MIRPARPSPALLTSTRSGPSSEAAPTAACTCSSSATSAFANTPADLGRDGAAQLLLQVQHDDVRAALREQARRGRAQPGRTPGDDGRRSADLHVPVLLTIDWSGGVSQTRVSVAR